MNWGCTLRVGQMLICNTLMRHLIIDNKDFYYKDPDQFEEFQLYEKLNLSVIECSADKYQTYLQILS